jgi:hypothetical protein
MAEVLIDLEADELLRIQARAKSALKLIGSHGRRPD